VALTLIGTINLKNQNMEKITKENCTEIYRKTTEENKNTFNTRKRYKVAFDIVWYFCFQNKIVETSTSRIEEVIGFIEGLIKENANLKNANDSFAIVNKLLESVIESNTNEAIVFNQKLDKITDNVVNQQATIMTQRNIIKNQGEKNTELKKLVSKLEQKNSELKMQINKLAAKLLLNKLEKEEQFVLPKKWCVKDCKEVSEWTAKTFGSQSNIYIAKWLCVDMNYFPRHRSYLLLFKNDDRLEDYTEITLKQFLKYAPKRTML